MRPAKSTIETRRRFIGNDDAVSDRQVWDVVSTRHAGVHSVKRRWFRRFQIRAHVFHLIPAERRHTAISHYRSFQGRNTVSGAAGGGQMLHPVFDPLDRAPRNPGRDRHQHGIGCDALLHAETAARIRRRANAQARGRHLQRHRHNGLDGERALKVGQHVIDVFMGVVVCDQAEALNRAREAARIDGVDRHHMGRRRECLLNVAVIERPLGDQVAAVRRGAAPVRPRPSPGWDQRRHPAGRSRPQSTPSHLQRHSDPGPDTTATGSPT